MSKWNLTSLCSASYVSWQRDTARISCWENACSNRQAAGPATVNPPDGIDGQTDKRTDRQTNHWSVCRSVCPDKTASRSSPFHRLCSAYYANSVLNHHQIIQQQSFVSRHKQTQLWNKKCNCKYSCLPLWSGNFVLCLGSKWCVGCWIVKGGREFDVAELHLQHTLTRSSCLTSPTRSHIVDTWLGHVTWTRWQ